MLRIIAVGDIMPGGVLAGVNDRYVSQEVLSNLNNADIRVGTLETAIGNEPNFYEEKMKRKADVIYTKDADLVKLQQLKIDIVSLANNHFFDLGPEGAVHTIQLLDNLGIKHIGAGANIEEASKPVVVEKNGKKIAFLAFCDWREETVGWCPIATKDKMGVNPMYDDNVTAEIRKCKSKFDYVVVLPHWGIEYLISPSKEVYIMSQLMIDSGADLILGGHTHCVQPIWNIKKKSIVFSMGNFLFPDRLLTTPRSTYYPDAQLDYKTLPRTDGYPRYVDRVTFKAWRPIARVGMIVNAVIDDKGVYCKPIYTRLSDDNYIDITECPASIMKIVKRYGFYLSTGHYLMALNLHDRIRSIFHK